MKTAAIYLTIAFLGIFLMPAPEAMADASVVSGTCLTEGVPAPGGVYVMSPERFMRVQRRMAASFDDNQRLRIARRSIRNHNITTMQAGILLSMLALEQNRVKLARFAYPRVADKGNFRSIYTLFRRSSSIRKIERTIRDYQR